MERIVLVGGGGHCKVIIDAIIKSGKYDIEGVVDPELREGVDEVLGVPVLGDDDELFDLYTRGVKDAFISVGSVGDCSLRRSLYKKVSKIGFNFPVIIHPGAVIAEDVKESIGKGTFIAAGAVINPGTHIGENVIINTRSSIDHDCEIGDFVHIAPGVTLSGGVKVGAETHIGTGANVTHYRNIGRKCMIKAGALISKDMNDGEVQGSARGGLE